MPTDQLNLRPLVAVIERLEKLAKKYKGDEKKKNEVAVEILERYIDSWEDAEIYQRTFIESQKRAAHRDLQVLEPRDTQAPAARGIGEIHGATAAEVDEVGRTEKATPAEVEDAHGKGRQAKKAAGKRGR